jgi:hypothetical protein
MPGTEIKKKATAIIANPDLALLMENQRDYSNHNIQHNWKE